MRGIRTRLALALVALVAVTVTAIGVGTYVFVEARLRDGLLAERGAPGAVQPLRPRAGAASGDGDPRGLRRERPRRRVPAARRRRDDRRLPRRPAARHVQRSACRRTPSTALPPAVRDTVAAGRLGYSWQAVAGTPSLVLGGRSANGGPDFYFVFPADAVDAALSSSASASSSRPSSRSPSRSRRPARRARDPATRRARAARAAARIAAGDLSARVPAGGADEFARLARSSTGWRIRCAATVARLEGSERQNRRFVADVSHELRTPLTALVAEASIIEAGLGAPPAGRPPRRRAARRRRPPAARPRRRPDGAVAVRRPGRAGRVRAGRPRRHGPRHRRQPPADRRAARPRRGRSSSRRTSAAWIGSSATCSTTRARTRRARRSR